jgi:DNA-binding transcriptional LysR family regulator
MPPSPLDADRRLGNRLTLRDLQILIKVIQLGSMAKAASQLAISQPSISQAIADLEQAVGARLLDRGPQGVTPTIYGDIFLKRGLEVFDVLRQGLRDVDRIAAPDSGDVWIGSSDTWLIGFVPAVIQRLAQVYPNIVVHAMDANASDFEFYKLRERKLDLIIGRVERSRADDDLDVEVLYEEPFCVVVGACHPLAGNREIRLPELINERWMFSEPSNIVTSLVSAAFQARGLELPRASVRTASMGVFLTLLTSGNYVTVFPNSVPRYTAGRWPLTILPIDLRIKSPVGIFTLKNRTISPVVQLFIEEARREAKLSTGDAKG